MSFSIARDARPQVRTLLIAVAITVVLGFIPFAGFVTYPFRLFVTFIHEGGHALAAIVTGNSVQGLRVSPNGGGLVYTSFGNVFEQMLVASAGYLGAMIYGALLLILIRRAVAVRAVLYGTGAYILALALLYGFPNLFTIVAGIVLGAALIAAGRYASLRVANFLLAFLAVQCVVGALFDLRTLISLSAPLSRGPHTDAVIMQDATHLPPIVWAIVWSGLALVILAGSLWAYAGGGRPDPLRDTPSLRRRSLRA